MSILISVYDGLVHCGVKVSRENTRKTTNVYFKILQVGVKNGVLEANRACVSLTIYGLPPAGSSPRTLHSSLSSSAYSLIPTKRRE